MPRSPIAPQVTQITLNVQGGNSETATFIEAKLMPHNTDRMAIKITAFIDGFCISLGSPAKICVTCTSLGFNFGGLLTVKSNDNKSELNDPCDLIG